MGWALGPALGLGPGLPAWSEVTGAAPGPGPAHGGLGTPMELEWNVDSTPMERDWNADSRIYTICGDK